MARRQVGRLRSASRVGTRYPVTDCPLFQRFPRALAYAEDGLRYATSGTARVRLLGGVAQCHANMGSGPAARAALGAAVFARDRAHEPDDLPGLFTFSQAKQHYYSGSALIWLDTEADARRARAGAEQALALWAAAGSTDRALDDEALAHIYAATASLQLNDLESAVESLNPILDLPEDRRISWIHKRLERVDAMLSAKPYAKDPLSIETRARIAEYR